MGRAYEVRKASIQKTGAARGKIYTTFAKEIYLVAKKGGADEDSNINLKRLIEKAKKQQVPNDIIKRAIDKAKGNNGEDYQEVMYEGFGPGNSTFMIKCLTDNLNRSVASVREAFTKTKNKLGVTNSVAYNYDYLAIIGFKSDKEEEVFEELLNDGIELIDFENNAGELLITCKPNDAYHVKDVLERIIPDLDLEIDEVGMYPKEKVKLNEEEMENYNKLMNILDNVEDVSEIYHNIDL